MKRQAKLAAFMLLGLVMAFPVPARADAPQAERVAAAAREAARSDRNAEAAALFQRAISLDPSRRGEWLRELADQMTYSGQAREALALYREMLAIGPAAEGATDRRRGGAVGGRSGGRTGYPEGHTPKVGPEGSPTQGAAHSAPSTAEEARRARRGLALALSWSHELTASLREYDVLLREDANDVEARLGRARVLSWMDRHVPAKREYEAVLRQDPSNIDARRSLGRIQSWRGKHRDAQRRLVAFLEDHPGDAEGALLLAQTQAWMGRPDRAKQTLRNLLARDPEDPRGKDLLEEIRRREQPDAGMDYQQSHQSDGLVISTESFQQNFQQNEGRTTLGARYQKISYAPDRGQSGIAVKRPGMFARHWFSDRSELTANLYLDLIEPGGSHTNHTEVTYDTYFTLWPNDVLRFDLGSSRTTFDNVNSLRRGITGTYANFSMDVTPDEKTRLTARFNWGSYSDGNQRRWGQVEAEQRVWTHPNLLIGVRYTAFGFSRRLDHGYFNPGTYQAGVLTLRIYGHAGDRLSYDLDGSYGREHANPGGGKPSRSAGVRLTYKLADRMQIEGRYQFFSSTQASSGGFARRTTGLSLRFLF
jgi:tetratricopeptide (TPR) repeat protein